MDRRLVRRSALVLATLGLCGAIPLAAAQGAAAWPERAIRIVLPFPPGGPSDIAARLAADKMQPALKQPIVIENKPGAGGNVGTAEVARAAPDGYTWLFGPDSLVTVNPHVYKQMPFKVDDLVPVTVATRFNQTLVCNPALGVKTVAELVAKAKASPLSYASGGVGVPGHLSMELLQSMAGFQMNHVPYKGPAPATQDVLGNQVSCGLLASPTVLPHVRSGKLRALSIVGATRSSLLPEVPTLAELKLPEATFDAWYGFAAPARTPQPVIDRLVRDVSATMAEPALQAQLRAQGMEPVVIGAAAFRSQMENEISRYRALAHRAGIAPE